MGPKREAGVRLVGTEEEGWICKKEGRVGDERGASNKWHKRGQKYKATLLGQGGIKPSAQGLIRTQSSLRASKHLLEPEESFLIAGCKSRQNSNPFPSQMKGRHFILVPRRGGGGMETRGFFASFFWAERTIRPISRTLKLILRRLGIQGIPDAARL